MNKSLGSSSPIVAAYSRKTLYECGPIGTLSVLRVVICCSASPEHQNLQHRIDQRLAFTMSRISSGPIRARLIEFVDNLSKSERTMPTLFTVLTWPIQIGNSALSTARLENSPAVERSRPFTHGTTTRSHGCRKSAWIRAKRVTMLLLVRPDPRPGNRVPRNSLLAFGFSVALVHFLSCCPAHNVVNKQLCA